MKVSMEYTDTFGDNANYAWVRRTDLPADVDPADERAIVRMAKAWADLTGVPCRRDDHADSIVLYPCGMTTVLSIVWIDD